METTLINFIAGHINPRSRRIILGSINRAGNKNPDRSAEYKHRRDSWRKEGWSHGDTRSKKGSTLKRGQTTKRIYFENRSRIGLAASSVTEHPTFANWDARYIDQKRKRKPYQPLYPRQLATKLPLWIPLAKAIPRDLASRSTKRVVEFVFPRRVRRLVFRHESSII